MKSKHLLKKSHVHCCCRVFSQVLFGLWGKKVSISKVLDITWPINRPKRFSVNEIMKSFPTLCMLLYGYTYIAVHWTNQKITMDPSNALIKLMICYKYFLNLKDFLNSKGLKWKYMTDHKRCLFPNIKSLLFMLITLL